MVKCFISSTELFSQCVQSVSQSNSLPANMILQDQNKCSSQTDTKRLRYTYMKFTKLMYQIITKEFSN